MAAATTSRDLADIFKDLYNYNPIAASSEARLPHDCYMIRVGSLKAEHAKMLQEMSKRQGSVSSKDDNDKNQAHFSVISSDDVEWVLEHMILEGQTEQLVDQRKNYFVYEDNFNTALIGMIEADSSYETLKEVCRKYERRTGIDLDKVMAEHENRVNVSYAYFHQNKVSIDESKALALSLSFYTGTKSEACNRGASLVARQGNGEALALNPRNELNEAAIILYYLVKSLSYIPFHWGHVTRACQLTPNELSMYMPGGLITWLQFSSSKKGTNVVDAVVFRNRNTLFKVFSLTGRPIKQFSNYPEEDEVLFLPHTTFLVVNRETYDNGRKHIIYMRQVELGLCKWAVLWVDDEIFNEDWENKLHMEDAASKALDMNVHFIPKASTDTALSFLRSTFGQRLKNCGTFRIVTDMNRKNENSVHNAGSRLIKAIRQMGFNNECLVFTSHKERAQQILASELSSSERQSVFVSVEARDLRNFVNFDR